MSAASAAGEGRAHDAAVHTQDHTEPDRADLRAYWQTRVDDIERAINKIIESGRADWLETLPGRRQELEQARQAARELE